MNDDIKDDIEQVLYRALHEDEFATSDELLDTLMPHIDRHVAAELRRQADELEELRPSGNRPHPPEQLRARAAELEAS